MPYFVPVRSLRPLKAKAEPQSDLPYQIPVEADYEGTHPPAELTAPLPSQAEAVEADSDDEAVGAFGVFAYPDAYPVTNAADRNHRAVECIGYT